MFTGSVIDAASLPLALYDDDCGFCVKSLTWVRRLPVRVEFRAVQAEPVERYGITMDQALESMACVLPGGRVVFGHLAWSEILKTAPAPLAWVGRLMQWPVLSPLCARVYAWVATNRYRLPGGSAACALPPG